MCVWKLKNTKTGGSNGLVGELLTYGGSGMVELLQQLFTVGVCATTVEGGRHS